MRAMLSDHGEALHVAAAHSRVIQPGDRVDFDEVVHPANGSPYSLETALGPDAAKFTAAPAPEPEPEVEPKAADEFVSMDLEVGPNGQEGMAADGPLLDPSDPETLAALTAAVITEVQPAPEPEPEVEPKATGRGKKK